MDDIILKYKTNAELLHQLKYTRNRGKQMIQEVKDMIAVHERIKTELHIRLVDLEIELRLAEFDRLNCEDPFFDALLDLH